MSNKYKQPEMPTGYSFVAAATLYRSFAGLTVYVKYKSGSNTIKVKRRGTGYLWLECPDRELVIVKNSYNVDAFYPWANSFDEAYDFNLFNDKAAKALEIEYIMTNFAHSAATKNPRITARTDPSQRIQVLSDSGGLQLSRDVAALIHPERLIEFYNNNVDAGMVLDIPLVVQDSKIAERAARLQKRNTDIMLAGSKGVELINIFHGHSDHDRQVYREIVEDERINRVAMAALHRQGLLTCVDTVYRTIYGSKKRYNQYHALGVYISAYIPLFVKIANTGENPIHLTSDSTSHIQSASNKAYHFQFDIYHNSKRIPIGSRGSIPNSQKIFPCQCPVCKTLKYMDVLAFGENSFTLELLSIHNAIEMTRYAKQLQEACRSMSSREFNQLVVTQLKRNPELAEVKQCLDFIDIHAEHGIKAARKKYEPFLNRGRVAKNSNAVVKPLFGEMEVEDTAKKHEHIKNLLSRMEQQIK